MLKFTGTLKELKALLIEHGIRGMWYSEPNGVHLMRYRSGANLHWSSTTGRIWLNGKPNASVRLGWLIEEALAIPVTG